MSDLAHIVIEKDLSGYFPHEVFFSTPHHGYRIKQRLQKALRRSQARWQDGPYLSQLILSQLMGYSNADFGISTAIREGGRNLLCVNLAERKVRERDSVQDSSAAVLHEWTFDDYVVAHFREARINESLKPVELVEPVAEPPALPLGIQSAKLLGRRLAPLVHAVPDWNGSSFCHYEALCGKKPSDLSAGWGVVDEPVTCYICRQRLAKPLAERPADRL
jgi:hypothetical protein